MIEGKFRIDYEKAYDIAQTNGSLEVAVTGGFRRFVTFTLARGTSTHGPDATDMCEVSVMLFKTQIARYCADRVVFTTGGYDTATTRDAMNFLIGGQPIGGFHILDHHMHYRGPIMRDGRVVLDYAGNRIAE